MDRIKRNSTGNIETDQEGADMKKIIIVIFLISMVAMPSYALNNQNPIKKIIGKVASLFRENPIAKQRKQIQDACDLGQISQEECDDRLAEIDRQQEAYKEVSRQLKDQRQQGINQPAAQ